MTAFNELRVHDGAEDLGVQTVGVTLFVIPPVVFLTLVWLLDGSGEKSIEILYVKARGSSHANLKLGDFRNRPKV